MTFNREITFCQGSMSFKELIELFFEISDKKIPHIRIRDLETATLPFEEHSESLLTKYVPCQEVYKTIDLYTSPDVATRLKKELNQSYPFSVFQNQFPLEEALNKICQARVL